MRRALAMREEGATIRAVCAEMAAAGLRSRRGKEIGPSSMLKILGNRVYVDNGWATN